MTDMTQIRRVPRTHQQARASYDRMSRWYDLLAGSSEQKYKERGLELLDVVKGEKVLEIGFGSGQCLPGLVESAGETGWVIGVDLSTGMGRIAREKMRIAKIDKWASLVCGDATRLPFPEGHFDAIFMSFTLELFDTPEIPIVLNECQRMLQPQGRMCVVSLTKKDSWVVNMYERVHDWWPRAVDCRPIYPRQSLEGAGFQCQKVVEMSMFGLPVEIVICTPGKLG